MGPVSGLGCSGFSSVQSLIHVQLFVTPWTAACFPAHHQLPEFTQTHVHRVGDAIQQLLLFGPLLLLPSIFPRIRVFSNESVHHIRWPKYWSLSFSISPSNEYSGLISFRMDWLDLLVVQGTLKSLLQHHGSKSSILQHSAFFIVQLSHPYMPTGKTLASTRWTFVGKIMSLLLICCLDCSGLGRVNGCGSFSYPSQCVLYYFCVSSRCYNLFLHLESLAPRKLFHV